MSFLACVIVFSVDFRLSIWLKLFDFLGWGFRRAMEKSDASSVCTASDSVNFDEHKIWNFVLELLLHVQVGGVFQVHLEEIDLARIALSCHCAAYLAPLILVGIYYFRAPLLFVLSRELFRTGLNHKCRCHVLDHWKLCRTGNNKFGRDIVDEWSKQCVLDLDIVEIFWTCAAVHRWTNYSRSDASGPRADCWSICQVVFRDVPDETVKAVFVCYGYSHLLGHWRHRLSMGKSTRNRRFPCRARVPDAPSLIWCSVAPLQSQRYQDGTIATVCVAQASGAHVVWLLSKSLCLSNMTKSWMVHCGRERHLTDIYSWCQKVRRRRSRRRRLVSMSTMSTTSKKGAACPEDDTLMKVLWCCVG